MQSTGLNPFTIPALKGAVAEVLKHGGTISEAAAYVMGSTRVGMSFMDSSGNNHVVEFRPETWKKGGKIVAQKIGALVPGGATA